MKTTSLVGKSLFQLGCELRALDRTEDEIFDEMWEANLERFEPPLPKNSVAELARLASRNDYRRIGNTFYSVVDGQLAKEGKIICNFDLEIKLQRTYDDGNETQVEYVLGGSYADGEAIQDISITSDEFLKCEFLKKLGRKAIVNVGPYNREHLKNAIQTLSLDTKDERIYSHTGFRKINGELKFLHAGGAVGSNGNDSSIIVDASSAQLQNVFLENASSIEELRKCCLEVLDFRKLGPLPVMVSLISFTFRAPTSSIQRISQILFITGPSGVFKTVLLGLMMSFYGRKFNHLNIPGNFESTANAIERIGFQAKDILLGIDDFAPDGTLYDVQTKSKMFQRIVRGAGNGEGGRNRMNADGTLRSVNYFRGAIVATGEDVPKNFSTRARMAIMALSKGDIDEVRLSHFQEIAAKGHFVKVMSGFIQWLCSKQNLPDSLAKKLTHYRDQCRGLSAHKRTPDTVASLALGYELFLDFSHSIGAISLKERGDLWNEAWIALGSMAELQRQYLTAEDTALNFIEYIKAVLLTGKAHLSNFEDCKLPPAQTDLWGWLFDSAAGEYKSKGPRIGWFNPVTNEVLLQPDAAYAAAQEFARSQGSSINLSKDVLLKRLAEKNLILKSDLEKKNLVKRTPDGESRKRLLIFPDPNLFLTADIRDLDSCMDSESSSDE